MTVERNKTGILLVGHGTRDVRGRAEYLETVESVRRRLANVVEPGFLELAEPSISVAIEKILEQNVQLVLTCPLLLFAAGHVKRDIPRAVNAAVRGRVPVKQVVHLGQNKHLLALSSLRYQETVDFGEWRKSKIPMRTLLILVGRGSQDSTATAAMFDFSRRRSMVEKPDEIEVCFLAMCRPSLEETLERAGKADFEQIVVQPHLLFHGELLSHLRERVNAAAKHFHRKTWLITSHLGPHPLLVKSILARIEDRTSDFA